MKTECVQLQEYRIWRQDDGVLLGDGILLDKKKPRAAAANYCVFAAGAAASEAACAAVTPISCNRGGALCRSNPRSTMR